MDTNITVATGSSAEERSFFEPESNDISKVIAHQLNRIQQLKDFVSLYFRREQISQQLTEIDDRIPSIQQLLYDSNQLMTEFEEKVVKEHTDLLKRMQNQQLGMLYLMSEIQNKREEENQANGKGISNGLPLSARKGNVEMEKPRMFLSEYQQSPMVSKIRPKAIIFLDFEASITQDQFSRIPKYLRGRETFDELSGFLHNIIVPCFMEKYQLLHRKRECVRNPRDLEIWKLYQEQVRYLPGHKFITQGDISRQVDKLVDKKTFARIAMLRHLGILQEQRKSSIICYVWNANNYANINSGNV